MLSALPILLLAALPGMEHGTATLHTGSVVAAPHEGFDAHSGLIARDVARRLHTGWVVATGYRSLSQRRWINVNRPTECLFEGRRRQKTPARSGRAKRTYAAYQRRVNAASGRAPLDLLIEIHGHARRASIGGKAARVQVIELATIGFAKAALKRLRVRYRKLASALPEAERVQLAIEQLDPSYVYQGQSLRFYFHASGAKREGSLAPARTRRALHFELPQRIRFSPERRVVYGKLLARLLAPLLRAAKRTPAAQAEAKRAEAK